jgi:hypothetical protein
MVPFMEEAEQPVSPQQAAAGEVQQVQLHKDSAFLFLP